MFVGLAPPSSLGFQRCKASRALIGLKICARTKPPPSSWAARSLGHGLVTLRSPRSLITQARVGERWSSLGAHTALAVLVTLRSRPLECEVHDPLKPLTAPPYPGALMRTKLLQEGFHHRAGGSQPFQETLRLRRGLPVNL
ncbi:hypothetical protein BDM02DRAFT_2323575 [Thelephora ganbajun]|uniref:Uncharacterized protein n=1 Tax=Thelephora ganbajun TaxID=370292 RepID=A0ACB6ZFG1_THEGA|nr:hypothetical protein BDM02DRAFT_2323575 [Thelephora ganbajun]